MTLRSSYVVLLLLAGCGGSQSENTDAEAEGGADVVSNAESGLHADGAAEGSTAPDGTAPDRGTTPLPDGAIETGTPQGDAGATPADGGGYCCLPSPSPSCCMNFGGWTKDPAACGDVCDGFRLPTQLTKDSHGCDAWTGGAGGICGAAVDGGPSQDAEADATPPGCPASYGSDGGDCPTSSACRYPQGLCDCESNHCGGAQLPDASTRSVWTCTALDPSCPPAYATGGTCAQGVTCSYGYCCAPTIQCGSGGTWQSGVGFCPP